MVFESFVELYKSSVSTQYHLNQGHITEKIVWITTKHFYVGVLVLGCKSYGFICCCKAKVLFHCHNIHISLQSLRICISHSIELPEPRELFHPKIN